MAKGAKNSIVGKRATQRKRKPGGVNPKKVLAYMETKSGKTQQQVAKELNVSQQAVSIWKGEVEEYLRQCPEYGEASERMAKMIPMALDVYEAHLKTMGLGGNPDVTVATNVLKNATILKDKQIIEANLTKLSDDELDQLKRDIVERVAERYGSTGENKPDQGIPGEE